MFTVMPSSRMQIKGVHEVPDRVLKDRRAVADARRRVTGELLWSCR